MPESPKMMKFQTKNFLHLVNKMLNKVLSQKLALLSNEMKPKTLVKTVKPCALPVSYKAQQPNLKDQAS